MSLNDLFPKNLYHSYIVEGESDIVTPVLTQFLIERGDIMENSADTLVQSYDSFTIDDSQNIKEWHSEKHTDDRKKICIIGTKFINHDAERTLLKILEEPTENTHFFIIIPNAQVLLDTIRSRSHIVKFPYSEEKVFSKNAEDFISLSITERLEEVAKIITLHKDNENSGGLRHHAIALVNAIEKIIYTKWQKNNTDKNLTFILSELAKSREYLGIPGASVKMILENIALML